MNRAMVGELRAALGRAENEEAVRVLVLRGAGGHFCAGGDVSEMAQARAATKEAEADPIAELSAEFGRIALAFSRTNLPVIAIVEGAVMGGGFGIACTADVVIASTTARFRLPETSLGVVPAQIAPFLVERLGYSEAKRLAVTGARLDAAAAKATGLVHEVVEPDALDVCLDRVLGEILASGPEAIAATKALLGRLHSPVADADIQHAAAVFAKAARSDEAMEGMTAFVQKRKPRWARG